MTNTDIYPDLQFSVEELEQNNSGILLFHSSFSEPTYLFKHNNGVFDWLRSFDNGETKLAFRISEDWTKISLYEDNSLPEAFLAFKDFGILFSYAVLNQQACVLHGVVMEYKGKGILVTAAAGTGKTTHTRMWRDLKNALIINGDRCLCRKVDGVWWAYGMPWSGSSGEYINRKVPISAIVCLKRGKVNETKRLGVFDATMEMMQRIFMPTWPCDMQNKAMDYCEDLGANIPIFQLNCLPNEESVEVLLKTLEDEVWKQQ